MSLFLAVWPDRPTVEVLSRLGRPERHGVRWTDPGHWHVTLAFLGAVDAGAAASALDQLDSTPAPTVALGPNTRLLNRTVLMVPASGLDELAGAARSACAAAGLELEDRPFRGHLTLARGRRPGDLARLGGEPVEARFQVSSVDLVDSSPVRGGGPNRYEVLGRRPVGTPRV